MTLSPANDGEQAAPTQAVSILAASRITTWRYQGERLAADSAYCSRFQVTQAPEPYHLPGGVWAYLLPAVAAPRS